MTRVLVVDDEAPLRLLYRVNLEAEGFEVVDAADGLSGLAAAKEASPDVILLDVWMPALDGWQVAERLQSDAATRGVPIVFVTAQSRSRDRLRGFGLGAVDFIALPVNPLELAPRLRALLAQSSEERDAARREKIAELERWVQREDGNLARLCTLIKQHADDVFGSPVTKVLDSSDGQMLHLWLDDGSKWLIRLEATNPPDT